MNLHSKKEKTIRNTAACYKVICDPDFFTGSMDYTRLYGIFPNGRKCCTFRIIALSDLQARAKLILDVPHFSSKPHGKS